MPGIHRLVEHDVPKMIHQIIHGHRAWWDIQRNDLAHFTSGTVPSYRKITTQPLQELRPDVDRVIPKRPSVLDRPIESAHRHGPS